MAAGEEHAQLVVGVQRGALEVGFGVVAHGRGEVGGAGGGDAVMAQAVERPAPRGGGQPGAGAVGHTAAVPLDRRGDERVLHDVLREREIAVQPPADGGQDGGALVAEGALERARGRVHASW